MTWHLLLLRLGSSIQGCVVSLCEIWNAKQLAVPCGGGTAWGGIPPPSPNLTPYPTPIIPPPEPVGGLDPTLRAMWVTAVYRRQCGAPDKQTDPTAHREGQNSINVQGGRQQRSLNEWKMVIGWCEKPH